MRRFLVKRDGVVYLPVSGYKKPYKREKLRAGDLIEVQDGGPDPFGVPADVLELQP